MLYLQKLKVILQSKYFYLFLLIFITIYIFITTILIKYETNLDNSDVLEGYIIDINYQEDKISFVLKVDNEKVNCTFYTKEKFTDLLGKKVIVTGKIKELKNNTIPNTFNYKKYLYRNHIYLSYSILNIKVIGKENIFYKIKNKIINRINASDSKIKPYFNLFILGDKNYLDSELYNTYRSNGIWHLFAISGMHISLIILIMNKLLNKLKGKTIIIMLTLFYFMFLTGFSASVMRATIFYILKNILDLLNIKLDNQKILFLTAFIILIYNPFMIFNSGFQYSFLITLAIMLKSSSITGNYVIKIFKISLLSFIVSMPITINLNYEINLLSIFLNIFYVPLISLIIFPLSILTFLIPFLAPILKIFILLLEVTNNLLIKLGINIVVPKMPFLFIIFYYLILLLYYRFKRKKFLYLLGALISINYFLPKLDNNYYVYFLDVGQGDSSVFISPRKNEVIMIDTGGAVNSDYHVSDNVILFLKSLGINKIDLLIITHGDADHGKEALNYLEKFKIKNIILNNNKKNSLETFIEKEGNVVKNYKSKYFNFQNINDYLSDDENYSSIITYMNINNYNFLMMGDAPKEIENKLISDYNLQVNFLKIGHHGSNTSTGENFIEKIQPDISIISVGQNNRYGHPKEEVLKTLKNYKLYRTDLNGTIRVKIYKNQYKLKTYAP